MSGPIARNPLPREPEWRDRWRDALCAVCGHSRGTHESLPADHRFVPRPAVDPARPGDSDTAQDPPRLGYRKGFDDGVRYARDIDRTIDRMTRHDAEVVDAARDGMGNGSWPPTARKVAEAFVALVASSVPPQPTVPRAPVEALLAAWDAQTGDNTTRRDLAITVAEVRRHLNGDTT